MISHHHFAFRVFIFPWCFLCLAICTAAFSQSADTTMARKYYDEGLAKMRTSEFKKSNELLNQSAGIYHKFDLKEKYISCQLAIATNFKLTGDFDKSDSIAVGALRFIQKYNLDWFSGAKFFKLRGQIKSRLGDYKEAEEYFRKAISYPSNVKMDSSFTGKVYNDIGNLCLRKRDLDGAIKYFNNSIPLLKEQSDKNITKGNIAIIYNEIGNYSRAISILNEVIDDEIKITNEKSATLKNHYLNIGRCYSDIFDSYKALEYFEKALDLYASNRTHPAVAKILNNIGIVYLDTKDYEKSRLYFDSAMALNAKLFAKNYEDFAYIFNNVGASYMEQRDYVKALDYYNKALSKNIVNADSFMIIRSYNKIGRVRMLEEKYDEALIFFNKAVTLGALYKSNSEIEISNEYIASIHATRKNYIEAIKSVNAAIGSLIPTFKPKTLYEFPDNSSLFVSYTLLELITNKAFYIKMLADEKKQIQLYTSALAAHESAVSFLDKLDDAYSDDRSKINLRKDFLTLFEEAIAISYDLYKKTKDDKYLEKAFYFSEKNKATRLRQAILHQYALRFSGIPDSLIAKETDLRSMVNHYQQSLLEDGGQTNEETQEKLFNLKNQHARLIEIFKQEYPKFYDLKYKSDVASVEDIRKQLLDDKSAMIKYFSGHSAYYAFVVTKDSLKIHKLVAPGNIDALSESMLQAIKGQDFKSYGYNAFQLYNNLIKPLSLPQAVNRLVIVPDGKLYYIPFEGLIKKLPADPVNVKSLAYLIRDYSVQYHVSATLMVENLSHKYLRPEKKFAAFAPIEFNPMLKIPALFGSEAEAKDAAKNMNGDCLVRNQATESTFKNTAGSYAILHLATHAVIDDYDPLKSKLLFSAATDSVNDGVLHNYELYNLQLQADLVTLSACNTGAGKLEEGEGVMSLARAFMYAGSQSLLMSLWPASDNASQLVMKFFYEELANGKSKAEALQKAKIRYLDQADELSADPFLWTNFVLVGDEGASPKSYIMWTTTLMMIILFAGYYFNRKNKSKLFSRFRKPARS